MNLEKLWVFTGKLTNQLQRGLITPREYKEEMERFIQRIDCALAVLSA